MLLSLFQLKDICGNATGCSLTILVAASLEAFVVVQAVRLDAEVSISFIHECHCESVSFLCPQDWTWKNTEEHCDRDKEVLRDLR